MLRDVCFQMHLYYFSYDNEIVLKTDSTSTWYYCLTHWGRDQMAAIFQTPFHWISLKFVPGGPINDIPVLVQIMAWRQIDHKPLSEPMLIRFTDAYMWHWGAMYIDTIAIMFNSSEMSLASSPQSTCATYHWRCRRLARRSGDFTLNM